MMNLEIIEQRCLAYLKQVSNPLVPFESIVRHLRSAAACPPFEEAELLAFLRKHELFRVIDPPQEHDAPEIGAGLDAMGVFTGPQVILDTRVPTVGEAGDLIDQSLACMSEALDRAMDVARETDDKEAQDRVLDVMARARKLKEMVHHVFHGEEQGRM